MSVCAVFLAGRSGAQDLPPGKTFRDCSECPEMVVIPAGKFLMGTSTSDHERDVASRPPELALFRLLVKFGLTFSRNFLLAELPQHAVTIPNDFAMGKYPVTVAEFSVFVRETGYSPLGNCLLFNGNKGPISSTSSWENDGF
jgi:formylglycine-generating enzyme required for sulfatase activity